MYNSLHSNPEHFLPSQKSPHLEVPLCERYVKLYFFAASMDVEIINTRLIISPPSATNPLQKYPVEMVFRQDRIALENNETFTLTLTGIPLTRFGANPTIRDTMTGTVIDSTGKDSSCNSRCLV